MHKQAQMHALRYVYLKCCLNQLILQGLAWSFIFLHSGCYFTGSALSVTWSSELGWAVPRLWSCLFQHTNIQTELNMFFVFFLEKNFIEKIFFRRIFLRREKGWNWQLIASDVIMLGVAIKVIPAVTSVPTNKYTNGLVYVYIAKCILLYIKASAKCVNVKSK